MEYKASLDILSKGLTAFIFVLLLLICFSVIASKDLIAFLFITLSVFIFCYLFHTQKYIIENGDLVIKRPGKDKRIPISEIRESRMIERGELNGTIRTFGVGGLFGYFGKFYSWKLGSLTFYTTQRRNRILILLNSGQKIIISPDDTSLLNHLKQH